MDHRDFDDGRKLQLMNKNGFHARRAEEGGLPLKQPLLVERIRLLCMSKSEAGNSRRPPTSNGPTVLFASGLEMPVASCIGAGPLLQAWLQWPCARLWAACIESNPGMDNQPFQTQGQELDTPRLRTDRGLAQVWSNRISLGRCTGRKFY